MITFVENSKIDKNKWDNCVNASSNKSIFVYSWYLDIVCDNWAALILNDYEAVFPFAYKTKYKINYIYQPFFTRYLGLYSMHDEKKLNVLDFINAIPQKYKFIDFCLHESNVVNAENNLFSEKKYHFLDLANSYESIQKQFSENTKRNIKKAKNNNLKVHYNVLPSEIVHLFESNTGKNLKYFNSNDYKKLIKLMEKCIDLKNGLAIGVYDGENLCAAAFFMFLDGRFTFLKSGVNELGKQKGAMHLLFNNIIETNSGKSYKLDFGGSSIPNIARFYSGFGSKPITYLHVKKNDLPFYLKWLKK